METTQLQSVSPIGDTDPLALPVADVGRAITYYTQTLGFALQDEQPGPPRTARLTRDDVTLGLAESGGDPEQASCYIAVADVAALQQEYQDKGVNVTAAGPMEHGGRPYTVFWAKDPDGLCYCFGSEAS